MEKVKHTYVLSLGLGLSIAFSSFSAIAQEHFNPRLWKRIVQRRQ